MGFDTAPARTHDVPVPAAPSPRRGLRVGAVHDPAERAADRVADDVLRRLGEARADAGPGAGAGAGAAVFATGTSRVHRSSSPRRATVGAAGGDAPEGFEARLAAVRPSGRPLDDVLRAPMEQAFGTDFGRIRLHDSAGSAALNDEIGARAFTIGSDIFTRDPIDASAPAGQRLLAHELAHTVQQGGRSDGAARTVRRAVGFEFEVGRWTLKAVEDPIDPTQVDGTNEVPTTDLVRFTKDHVVHAGTGFNLKPDEADDGSWHLEFVVEPPLQEVPAGRSRLKTVMKALQKFSARLVAAGPSAAVRVQGSADDWLLSESAGLNQRGWLMMPQSDMVGEPQTTGGVRLDQLADLMAIMATGSIIGETASESTARKIGGGYLTGKNAGDADLAGASPAEARARFADFPGRALHSPTTASKELISLLALIRTYLIKAATPAAYAKSIAPIMARTDFGTIFAAIPEAQYYRTYPNQWVALNLHVAGQGGQGAQPFFSGTSTYVDPVEWADIQNAMSRTDWLSTMTTGVDLLTVDHFPDPNVAGHLFGFGKLGGATDTVGKPGRRTEVQAPIFELRRMAGSIDYRVWPTLALELFDYFVALNRQKETTFTATKTRAKHWSL